MELVSRNLGMDAGYLLVLILPLLYQTACHRRKMTQFIENTEKDNEVKKKKKQIDQ